MLDILNIQPNKPKALLEDYTFLVYGRPKAGKTSLFYKLSIEKFGTLDKSLLLAFEKGYKALNGIHVIDIKDWETLLEVVEQLVDNYDKVSYRMICLDTLDIMYQYASDYVVRKERIAKKDPKIKTISDIAWGAGYTLVEEQVQKVLDKLIKIGYGIFMITHDMDKKFESRNGQSYDKTTISLTGRARQIFTNIADFIIFIELEREKEGKDDVENRYIYFRSDADIEAGSRFENVPERIKYSPKGFLEVFEEAVLHSYENDFKQVEEAKEQQTEERKEMAKDFVAEEKSQLSKSEFIQEIGNKISKMNKEQLSMFKAELKQAYGKINYKDYEIEQLKEVLEVVCVNVLK